MFIKNGCVANLCGIHNEIFTNDIVREKLKKLNKKSDMVYMWGVVVVSTNDHKNKRKNITVREAKQKKWA